MPSQTTIATAGGIQSKREVVRVKKEKEKVEEKLRTENPVEEDSP